MKKFFLIAIAVIALLFVSFTGNYLFKLNKSFDIFAEVIESLSNNYVLEVDPEILVKYGINGMLNSLDPYTSYYDEDDQEDLELFTEGTYSGIGINVTSIDSLLIVSDIKFDSPAHKSGLKIGDILYSIDSVVVLNKKPEDIRQIINYEIGMDFQYKVIRLNDTLEFKIRHEKIEIDDMPYADFYNDSIAYVKIDFFTKNTYNNLRIRLNELNREKRLKGIILDLRDNPGGLLYSSVEVCELFLPKNSLVVTTKGISETQDFKTSRQPDFEETPLIVIINENSASASEIVAGAIQDYDRGVIIGRQSFGKGLVQSIYNLSYGANLKVTTAKYYIPSGRSIQRIKFAEDYSKQIVEDTSITIYYTKNSREVKESSGIIPDTLIQEVDEQEFIEFLKRENIFFNFATSLSAHKEYDADYVYSKQDYVLNEFKQYITDNEIDYLSDYNESLDKINLFLENNTYSKDVLNSLNNFKSNLNNIELLINENRTEVFKVLEVELLRRILDTEDKYKLFLKHDRYSIVANSLFKSGEYNKILKLN